MSALEDLAAQEAACIREGDWEQLSEIQVRAQPLVELLGRDGPGVADAALTLRVARWSEVRRRSVEALAQEARRLQEEINQVSAAGRRVRLVAPIYGHEAGPGPRRLSTVG